MAVAEETGGLSLGFLQFMEAAPDAMVCVDTKGGIVLVNEQAEGLFGHRRNDMLGHSISMLIPERFHEAHEGHVAGYVKDPHVRPMGFGQELFARRADGTEFPVEISLSPIKTPEGTIVAASVRDVTERKQQEMLAREAQAKERELEHLKELDDFRTRFINAAAHELYTPLTPITATFKMLKSGRLHEDQLDHAYDLLERNFDRLSGLVEDLLEAARFQSGRLQVNPTKMDLARAVRDAVDSFKESAKEKGLKINADIPDGSQPCVGDPSRITQILYNLLSNAIKFSRRGDEITVAMTVGDDDAKISVADQGRGLEPEEIKQLFEPFVRLHEDSAPGTGLGLYISQGLVLSHGGRIDVTSDGHDKGATFTIHLPLEGPEQ